MRKKDSLRRPKSRGRNLKKNKNYKEFKLKRLKLKELLPKRQELQLKNKQKKKLKRQESLRRS